MILKCQDLSQASTRALPSTKVLTTRITYTTNTRRTSLISTIENTISTRGSGPIQSWPTGIMRSSLCTKSKSQCVLLMKSQMSIWPTSGLNSVRNTELRANFASKSTCLGPETSLMSASITDSWSIVCTRATRRNRTSGSQASPANQPRNSLTICCRMTS